MWKNKHVTFLTENHIDKNRIISILEQHTSNLKNDKDRKIQDGVDTRSYKVSFDKIQETLPGFACQWTVDTGIKNLLDELKEIDLNNDTFNKREFYRLQQIEFLHQTHQIDDNLIWVN